MNWNNLLTPLRFGSEQGTTQTSETRTHFQRDYDRIIFSSAFRRLQNKTQVFPLPGSVFVHNRLTHSLEVASVGRSLGNNLIDIIHRCDSNFPAHLVDQIPTIVATACLAHDMGNPPFGHSGEDAIKAFFESSTSVTKGDFSAQEWTDLTCFEGNANALRLLTQQLNGRREGGFRLSYPVLASIVKYPWESNAMKKKFGFFQSEKDLYVSIANSLGIPSLSTNPVQFVRHPLVYMVEAADDICYQIMDVEDAHKLGILSGKDVKELYLNFFDSKTDVKQLKKIDNALAEVTDPNEQITFLRAVTIGQLITKCSNAFEKSYAKIMSGEKVQPLIEQIDGHGSEALKTIKEVSFQKVYNHRTVVEIELAGYKILQTLLNELCNTVVNPSTPYNKKVKQLIPLQFQAQSNNLYPRVMGVVDFVSGMTDVYALEMYRTVQGISIPGINR
jgi:dGTPase